MKAEQEAPFHEFVSARWSRLVRTAYLLTGDVHHAEDLTQTALAKAYRSWRHVSRSDSPEAYVRRMLVNCNSDRFRKRRVREALTAVPPEVAGHDEAVSWTDERSALLTALAPRKDEAPSAPAPHSTASRSPFVVPELRSIGGRAYFCWHDRSS